MAILLTGAAGFIGSHLAERLLAGGETVVGLDNFDAFYARSVKEGNLEGPLDHDHFTFVEGDIRDARLLEELPGGIDGLIHIAALAGVRPSIREPARYADVNISGTVTLLEWARTRGIRDVLFASSSSVYGNNDKIPFSEDDPVDHPISPYAATKKAGELICHTYHHLFGMDVACLRFFTVYGPRQRPDLAVHKFSRLLAAGEPIPMFGDGTTRRDYTYIDDILDGVEGALRFVREGAGDRYEVINLGESRTIELREMIRVIGETMGVDPDIRQLPMQPGDVERTYADVSKARRLLDYRPSVGFEEGVGRFMEWFSAS